jgi:hypothetical protein
VSTCRSDDIELDVADVSLPGLVRRTEPVEVARDWPPPLDRAHRCGAFTLFAVHVPVPSIEEAAEVYGCSARASHTPGRPGLGRRRAVFRLASAEIVLVDDDGRRAVVLGVSSLERPRSVLTSVLLPADEGAWRGWIRRRPPTSRSG